MGCGEDARGRAAEESTALHCIESECCRKATFNKQYVYFTMQGAAELDPDDVGKNREKALALGNALLVCMAVPWALCVILYSGAICSALHFQTLQAA